MTTTRIALLGLLVVASAAAAPAASDPAASSNPTSAAGATPATTAASAAGPQRYIVLLENRPAATYEGGITGLAATGPRATGDRHLVADSDATLAYRQYLAVAQDLALEAIAQRLGRTTTPSFRYSVASNGFAIELTAEEARTVATVPGVATVEREQILLLQTDVGPQWIHADQLWNNVDPTLQTEGEGVLIGILDSGINLDHPSFAAVGSDGYPHVNPFGSGVYRGLCASDPINWTCNDKLVGYWIYTGETTDDTDNHGSRVASIAAGNALGAGLVDLSPWTGISPAISGVARHANLIGYDVCLDSGGCPTTATLAGIDQAVLDGVDVVNYSIGGAETSPWTSASALALLNADAAGVVMVVAAGNGGPSASTVNSPANAPWVLAAASASHPRASTNVLQPLAGGGPLPPLMVGRGLSDGSGPSPIVYAGDFGDALCLNPFTPGTWTGGEIVVCDRGVIARVAKGWNVLQGGAGGLVLVNTAPTDSLDNDIHHLPAVHVDSTDGAALKTWLASGSGHTAAILGAQVDIQPANADILAVSSARGPSLTAGVLKPDLTAPGVAILSAISSNPPGPASATTEYGIDSGTSFSSPHVAGAAALVRALHPSWTPAQIRSALASTAAPAIVLGDGPAIPANPFESGNGRADVLAAAEAGLLMDETNAAFTAADPDTDGDPSSLNLPSLFSEACCNCSWTRTFKAATAGSYEVVSSGLPVTAVPSSFTVAAGETRQVVLTPATGGLLPETWNFGEVAINETLNQAPTLHLPVAVMLGAGTPPPSLVTIATSEPTGTEPVPGIESSRSVTDLAAASTGLTRATVVDESLDQDPTNGDPFDNLNDGTTFSVPVPVPAGAEYLLAEIVDSDAVDMDLYVGSGPVPSLATLLCASTTNGFLESCRLDAPAAGDYWILVQNWAASVSPPDAVRLSYAVIGNGAPDSLTVTGPATSPACTPFDIGLAWYVPTPRDGERYYGSVTLGSSAANPADIGTIDVVVDFDNVTHWSLCSAPGVAIPDAGSITDTATSAESLTLDDVDLRIVADHTWVGDLIFTLEHVGGATAIVIDRPGYPLTDFGCGEDNIDVVVDDQGSGDIESQCDIGPAISGRRVGGDPPAPVLAVFRGEDLSGDWNLTVSDNATADTGSLVSWCLEVSLNVIFADGFESNGTSAWSTTSP